MTRFTDCHSTPAHTQAHAELIGKLSRTELERVLWEDEGEDAMRVCDLIDHHEVHHKGQIWMAARMIGLEVPNWVKRHVRLGDSP
jgi:uncharacterized damage-inducible protein DinB